MYKKFVQFYMWFVVFSIISLTASPIFVFLMVTHNMHLINAIGLWAFVPLVTSASLCLIFRSISIANLRKTVSQQSNIGNEDILRMLALRADKYLADYKNEIRDAGIRRLYQIEADHNTPVSSIEMQAVHVILHRSDEKMCIAAIKSLCVIGNGDSLWNVKKLIKNKTHQGTSNELQKWAEVCFLLLQERVAKDNNPEVLLRASAYTEAPTMLMRPALEPI